MHLLAVHEKLFADMAIVVLPERVGIISNIAKWGSAFTVLP